MTQGLRAVLILAIFAGVMLRFWNVTSDPSLWLDEVFSAQMAQSPLPDLLLAVPRFDTHPPLYYLQLHLWALAGGSDLWLLLNSVLLDLCVILSLWHVAGRLYGRETGLWAAALWAVLPLGLFFAENLRMYALFFLEIIWAWYLLENRIRRGGGGRVAVLLLGLAATLTHGLGFFVVFFLYFQALVRLYRAHGRRAALILVLDYIPVALASLWSLGIGSFRQTEGIESFDLATLGIHLAITFLGMHAPSPELLGYLALVLVLAALLAGRSRPMALWLVVLPFAVLLALTLTVKTVFMYRTLGLFLPFVVLGLARGRWPVLALALFAVAGLNSSLRFEKEGYRGAAELWAERAAPDAVMFTQGVPDLWGVSRYLPGVPRYSALDIQPPVRDGMLRLKERLTGTWFDRAGLFGQTDHLTIGSREIWPWLPEEKLAGLQSYWLLSPPAGTCLRDTDRIVESHAPLGKLLLLCEAQPG
ncbi:glycosyltransferase family 39 protein [Pseudogemmobacter humi]|uniref:Uncharacterized protein n=1 Tax=Pseudogemmobacter humi TaxID=2483812 RepID=A0A3P5WNU8_9RHOB|nr:glycosyltransferase family 39 protein [Pseudogemmobacter humi]VDC23418.1 hypothetical protein XINFAN_01035 [Pseudogemmobacter humi]